MVNNLSLNEEYESFKIRRARLKRASLGLKIVILLLIGAAGYIQKDNISLLYAVLFHNN